MKYEYLTSSPAQTKKMGELLAKEFLKEKQLKSAVVLGLKGELGGGKTTFLQGFAKGIGVKEKVLSPTFIIARKSQIRNPRFKNFYHVDCYRTQKPEEILDLGFKEIFQNPENIVVIEWADRIKRILPKATIWINFNFVDNRKRIIVIESNNGKI